MIEFLPPLAEIAQAESAEAVKPKQKASYIGAPAIFALEIALKAVNAAFDEEGNFGIYLVGSALERPNWRDVDVRMILSDEAFQRLFPSADLRGGSWEFDPRWTLMTVMVSKWLSAETGLPIDFQFQPQTHANERHKGPRHAAGLTFARNVAAQADVVDACIEPFKFTAIVFSRDPDAFKEAAFLLGWAAISEVRPFYRTAKGNVVLFSNDPSLCAGMTIGLSIVDDGTVPAVETWFPKGDLWPRVELADI